MQLSNRIGIIAEGHLVAEDSPTALKRRIGTDVIIVRVHGDPTLAEAAVAVVPDVDRVETRGDQLLAATSHGAAAISPVAVALDAAGIAVRELTLRTPTLDDVFLELTGGHLQPGTEIGDER